MRRSNLFRGLAAVFAILFGLSLGLTLICVEYEGSVNQYLNVNTSTTVTGGAVDFVYPSRYGPLSAENLDKLKADLDVFIASEMEEGAVLLENNGALPLADSGLKVSLFGHASYDPIYNNASAGGVLDPKRLVSLKDAIESVGYQVNQTLYDAYANGTAVRKSEAGSGSLIGEEPASFYTPALQATFADYSDAAIVVFARAGGEGYDLNTVDSEGISQLALHKDERDLLDLIRRSGFQKTIVLLNSANPMEIGELADYGVDTVLWIGTPPHRLQWRGPSPQRHRQPLRPSGGHLRRKLPVFPGHDEFRRLPLRQRPRAQLRHQRRGHLCGV